MKLFEGDTEKCMYVFNHSSLVNSLLVLLFLASAGPFYYIYLNFFIYKICCTPLTNIQILDLT